MKAISGNFRTFGAVASVALCAAWLAGCASDPAEVEERSLGASPSPPTPPTARVAVPPPGGSYRVVKGDTLYSIAFKRGLDYRDVAAWNGIAAPEYRILVGQEIRLGPSGAAAPAASTAAAPAADAAPIAAAAAPPRSSAKGTGLFEDVPNGSPPAASPPGGASASTPSVSVPAPGASRTGAAAAPAAVAASPAPAPAVKPAEPPTPPAARPVEESVSANAGGIAWRWPSGGKVIGTYVAGDQTRQGIDIGGAAGDPVVASSDGEVVYSGNGLLGYGELIIVKHNASFLSAYGHNRRRLVTEGDRVRAGQQIAEMGSTASSRDELHFEIRKNGKPVNPLDYLPAR